MPHTKPPPIPAARPEWIGRLVPLLIIAAAICGVFLVAAVLPARSPDQASVDPPPVNVEVLVIEPQGVVDDTFDLPGVVEPSRVVDIAAEATGRVEQISAAEGQRVSKGRPILRLDDDLIEAELARAKANLLFSQQEHARIRSARTSNVATERQFQEAEMNLATARADLKSVQTRLERTRIVAPLGGVLDRLGVEVGEYVSPGTVVATIVDVDTVKVVVDVPERDVPFVRIGRPERVFLNGRSVAGKIAFISELADAGTRTTRVELAVANPVHRAGDDGPVRDLRSGRIVRVRLTRRVLRDVVMVPLGAVIPMPEGKAVYVVVDGKARRRPVELGFIRGWQVEVQGLAAGDKLIVAGHRYVAPGQPVAIRPTPATAPTTAPATAPAKARGTP